MSIGKGMVVCVTGASGYIASWIVKFLLQRRYTVRATVRNPSNPRKVDHLLKLDGAKERLQLFKADLLEEGSFDSVIDGCHGVFHVASPVQFVVQDPQAELVDPAVKGTLNVLKSCAKSPSLKRVVLTSSMAAITNNGKPRSPDVVVDETWFSDPDFCRESKLWYPLSKILAENAAWKFVSENNIDMVVINPSAVIGTLLQSDINTTSDLILNLINGNVVTVHKRFQMLLMGGLMWKMLQTPIFKHEITSANGRYCLAERVSHYSGVVKILRDLYPTLQTPDKCEDDNPYAPTFQISKERAKSLGIEFIPLEVSLKQTVESLKEKKFVNF